MTTVHYENGRRVGVTRWVYNDGGDYLGKTRSDCVCRAIAIATETPYTIVHEQLNTWLRSQRQTWRARECSSDGGVYKSYTRRYMAHIGLTWTPTMQIGQGCLVHLRADELPTGVIVCKLSKHLCAVIDGIIHDTHDPSRDGTRCVYGYWRHIG